MIEEEPRTSKPELTRKQKFVRHTVAPVVALSAAFGAGMATESVTNAIEGVGHAVAEAFDNDLHFSAQNDSVVTQPGDTLWNIANKVEGSDKVSDLNSVIDYIKSIPDNQGIIDDNGYLKTGVQVLYPSRIETY